MGKAYSQDKFKNIQFRFSPRSIIKPCLIIESSIQTSQIFQIVTTEVSLPASYSQQQGFIPKTSACLQIKSCQANSPFNILRFKVRTTTPSFNITKIGFDIISNIQQYFHHDNTNTINKKKSPQSLHLNAICNLHRIQTKSPFSIDYESNRVTTPPLHSIKDPPNGPGKPVLQSEISKPSL